ncbi:ATP-binding protein [Streptomyces sp. BA2]|uniref:ATP-binding protein n=1 Tax=Streptomyces sp. BA2 TaxID=436595 RepID=UPI0013256F13|nr:ATP-binding protein [Streptomyces sp. BA2]MWA07843.1 AAA family ATPase [Streptomyces sp. BA2]
MNTGLFAQRLAVVEERVRCLYLEGEEYAAALHPHGTSRHDGVPWPDSQEATRLADEGDPLAHAVREFALHPDEADLLITCLLPDLIPPCGTAFRTLSGLAHSSRPTVAVALAVNAIPVPEAVRRGLLREGSPLVRAGLIAHENPGAPFPDRIPYVPDRVLAFLSGDREGIKGRGSWLHLLSDVPGGPAPAACDEALAGLLAKGSPQTYYLRQGLAGEALPAARAALRAVGKTPLLLAPEALPSSEMTSGELARSITLEARLLGAGLLIPLDASAGAPADPSDVLHHLVTCLDREPVPLILYGNSAWPSYGRHTLTPAETDLRSSTHKGLPGTRSAASLAAAERVHRTAALRSRTAQLTSVWAAARDSAAGELGRLARHIVPDVCWSELVVPDPVRERLRMLVARIEHRESVLTRWGLRRGGGRGRGTIALFAGESGTGKTMAAEALAGRLQMDLYIVSLPSVVSKYIGETEKNLERIFAAAETLRCVLLFDEADSLFAKRSEVRGAGDRHANLQSGYLLQRLESFEGLAILTTNLRASIDGAFTRRFDEVIVFESPGPEVRARLWHTFLGSAAPAELCVDELASAYTLAGGSIRASVESALFAAAADDRQLTVTDLVDGIETEYRKLGRLFDRRSRSRTETPTTRQ